MRNLRCVQQLSSGDAAGVRALAWDATNDSVLCLRDAYGLLNLERWDGDGFQQIASWDAPQYPYQILDLRFFGDTNSASIVFDGGDLVVVREYPEGEEKIEIVGSIDSGISAAAWSPDEELLVITTKANTLIYLTRDFEDLVSLELTARDLEISDHVSVGWGKKETQFKGKKARALRDPTVPETVDDGRLAETNELHETTISWRGDGAYVAINAIEESTQRRVIRIFSREGALDSVSEPVNGLIAPLSWRPAGNLLAGIQLFEGKRQVVFFERNGLRHGQFDLRPLDGAEHGTEVPIRALQWNVDSTVLAISYDDRVQTWTMGNYHWYLKQEIFEPSMLWHPENPLQLALVSKSQDKIRRLQYVLDVCSSPIVPPTDYGLVAVIDGKTLKVTPFRQANIPPPMALYEISLPANANDVMITLREAAPEQSSQPLFQIKVLHPDQTSRYILDCSRSEPPARVHEDGTLGQHQPETSLENSGSERPLSFEILSPSTEPRDFRLGENGSLLLKGRLLATGCTSFLVTPSHLIFTTSKHLLKFVHLATNQEALEVPPDTPESDERCRSIERGAKLVTAMPSIFAVVLQMPRGNLETIYPRALVLAGLRQNIADKKYKKAFLACRNQRVDMNIIHDHQPEQFIANVGIFIDQIRKTEHIDLFLSALKEEDVSRTMYRETLRADERPDADTAGVQNGKVNRICNAFLEALSGRKANVKNLITAQVCKNPPDLDAGLMEIVQLREKGSDQVDEVVEHICFLADVNRLYDNALGLYDLRLTLLIAQQSQKDPKEYLPFLQNLQRMDTLRRRFSIDDYLSRFKKAIRHLCDLSAFEEVKSYTTKHDLYQETMGLYRYDEEKFSSIMQLYANHLRNTSQFKAAATSFHYLNDMTQASECYRLANQWQESLSAATLIPLPSDQLRSLATTSAQSAIETKDFRAAATIFLDYLQDIPSATRYFCKGYLFTQAFRTITLSSQTDLLASIFDAGLTENMATITELLADCKAQLTAQVARIRELRQKKKEDPLAFFEGDVNEGKEIPDDVSLAATDAASTMGGSLFTRYTNRSMTGTAETGTSRRSSKNRRREERKRARGKKGSVYEEEYLVNSVRRLVERVNSVGEEVGRLVEWLVRRRMVERARAVEGGMTEVVGLCGTAVKDVFGGDEEKALVVDGEEGKQEQRDVPVVKEFVRLALLSQPGS
ncbi:Putative elongator complex protein 1 [Xanthoria calcicola]